MRLALLDGDGRVKLSDLSKPQWDAAREAARELVSGSPNREADRARFRAAKTRLAEMLSADADARDLILQAARWQMFNDIAAVCAGLPQEELVG